MEKKKGVSIMKRMVMGLICLCLVVFFGCGVKNEDFFEVFRSPYAAEVEGVLYGIEFSAKIEMGESVEGGCAPATITFYAPKELAGTTLSRAADGGILVKSGGLLASDMGGVGAALFSLLEFSGGVQSVEMNEEGHTCLLLGATEIELLGDGTPYLVKNEDVRITVLHWQSISS